VELAGVLGLSASPKGGAQGDAHAEVTDLEARLRMRLRQRLEAKRERDFATADRLRAEILAEGVDLFDKGGVGITTASGGPLSRPITVTLDPGDSEAPST
jgi:cysteinyl-tRNA synthetase